MKRPQERSHLRTTVSGSAIGSLSVRVLGLDPCFVGLRMSLLGVFWYERGILDAYALGYPEDAKGVLRFSSGVP